jgi:hypothetical protein
MTLWRELGRAFAHRNNIQPSGTNVVLPRIVVVVQNKRVGVFEPLFLL